MADQNPQQEPSMEEILASIRRIISEDGDESAPKDSAPAEAAPAKAAPAKAAPPPKPEPVADAPLEPAEPEPDDDVLELTEEVQEDGSVVDLKTGAVVEDVPAAEEDDEDIELEMVDAVEETQPEPEPAPFEESVVEVAATAMAEDRLVSAAPATDSVSSLAALAAAVDTHRRATDPSIGPKTIEDLVKEVMRPMIREWLDAHLPSLVERLVTREIERLTRDAEDISQR